MDRIEITGCRASGEAVFASADENRELWQSDKKKLKQLAVEITCRITMP